MEENIKDFIEQMKRAEEEKKLNEYYNDLELKRQHKKVKQLLRGGKTFNKKRIKERNHLLEVMKGYSELHNFEG